MPGQQARSNRGQNPKLTHEARQDKMARIHSQCIPESSPPKGVNLNVKR